MTVHPARLSFVFIGFADEDAQQFSLLRYFHKSPYKMTLANTTPITSPIKPMRKQPRIFTARVP